MKVNESGYYWWLKNRSKKTKRQILLVEVKEIIAEHPGNDNYRYNRIHKALKLKGIDVSRNAVYRLMKEGELIRRVRRPDGITKATTAIQKKEKLYRIPAYRLARDEVKTIVFRYIFVYYN